MTEHTLTLREHVTVTETPDGAVLLDQRAGKYWQLNATAALILATLRGGAAPGEAARVLADRHGIALDRAAADVAALQRTLRRADVLASGG